MNKTNLERLYNGLVKENPTFVLMLGMCPTLAVTTSAINGMGMGLTTAVVLALSNVIISLMRKIIPAKVRIPAFIVIIASFVTIVQLLLEAYLPALNESLGVYIPLIVVNCIILGRAEAYAYSNPPIPSLFDGIGMGLGFTVALTLIGAVREVLGAGQIFGYTIPGMVPIGIFVLAPGAFFVLAVLTAIQNFIKIQGEKRGKDMSKIQSGCNEDCMNCADSGCSRRFYDAEAGVIETTEVETTEVETVEETEAETAEETAEEVKKPNFFVALLGKMKKEKVSKAEKPIKKQDDVELIDLDDEDLVADNTESAEEIAEETAKEATAVEEKVEEAPAVAEEAAIEAAPEKPKRKPRKKKTQEAPVEAETAQETPVEEAAAEPAPEKPKRKPRKKKAEVAVEENSAAEAVENTNDTQEKEDN